MAKRDWQAVAVAVARAAIAEAAKLEAAGDLRAARTRLVDGEENTRSDDFPGSRRYLANGSVRDALRAFDSRHPEVFAAIRAKHDAKIAARQAGSEGLDQ